MNRAIVRYCLIAFAVTWLIGFGLAVAARQGRLSPEDVSLYHSFAALGPAIGAVVVAGQLYGRQGLRALWDRLTGGLAGNPLWWVVLSPVVFFMVGLFLYPVFKSSWFDFALFRQTVWHNSKAVLVWALPLLTYGIFEEIGWRGFLLPHLQERYTAWKATLILTPIWALWHLPFFFYRFDFSPFIAVGFFFGLFVGAVILTALYNAGRGGLLPVILFHFTNNTASAFDKEIVVAALSAGFVFLAVTLVKQYGRENLSPVVRTGNYFI